MSHLQCWRSEQDLAQYRDPVLAQLMVEEVDMAGGEGATRLEVVRKGLHRQFREHTR